MPGKQVSQATFDAIVREAIEDFGLSEEEALADAKEQLRAAGVTDFSGLITNVPASAAGEHPGVRFANALSTADSTAARSEALNTFAGAALSAEVIGVAGAHGAVEQLCTLLQQCLNAPLEGELYALLAPVCDAIARLCAKNEINRMRFVRCSAADSCAALKSALQNIEAELRSIEKDDADAVELCIGSYVCASNVLRAVRAVQRCKENIKTRIAGEAGLDSLLSIMDCSVRCLRRCVDDGTCSDGRAGELANIIRGVCGVIRQLLSADDTTVQVSETFNRARVLSGESSVMASGLKPLVHDRALPNIAKDAIACCDKVGVVPGDNALIADCLTAVRLCAVSDEICKMLIDIGYATMAAEMLRTRGTDVAVSRATVSLLRNLAARDQCKSDISKLVDSVSQVVWSHGDSDQQLVEHFCGYVASLCLRRPDISRSFAVGGVLDKVVRGMELFQDQFPVLKAGCLGIRNASSRDEEARQRIRSIANVEIVVRRAQTTFPGECDDVAYSALRELDLLADSELRRDERYTMPDGMFSTKVIR